MDESIVVLCLCVDVWMCEYVCVFFFLVSTLDVTACALCPVLGIAISRATSRARALELFSTYSYCVSVISRLVVYIEHGESRITVFIVYRYAKFRIRTK